jgi:pheromone shutdown protein TraB
MMPNIKIIGTNHVSKESQKKIKKTFLEFQPDVIAIELDKERLKTLIQPNKKNTPHISLIKKIGLFGYLFVLIGGYIQRKIGSSLGVSPGEDMLFAYNLAKNNNLELLLIDRPIQITLRRLSKKFGFREKMRLFGDILKIPLQIIYYSILPKKIKEKKISQKKEMSFSVNSIPDDKKIESMFLILKKKYPSLYSVLILERNHIMMKRLIIFAKKNPNKRILAVVGAGHKQGMELLKEEMNAKFDVI